MKKLHIVTLLFFVMGAFWGLLEKSWAQSLEEEYWDELFVPAYKTPTELPSNEALREDLFALLSTLVEQKAKQPVQFYGSLKVFKNWGFFTGSVSDKSDKAIGFEPMGNSDCAAVWLRTCNGWALVDFSVGHSDAFWLLWHDQYGVPKALLQ